MPVSDLGVWTPPRAKRQIGVRYVNGKRGVLVDADAAKLDAWFESSTSKLFELEPIGMDIENHATDAVEKGNEALASLKKTLDQFRSTIANDLTSIKASSSRVQSETLQMKQAYLAAQSVLTSPDFDRAVANAERLAAALEAISRLSETRIKVAVFGGE